MESTQEEITHLDKLYEKWFLDYASYVILERAIPSLEDGLKPVQRRILHAMKDMDDGRFHKVANVIGQTMQYHPHGDAAIGDAIVNLGQKNLLLEKQGNWGDNRTGDKAAAARYIETRLSSFANEVGFFAPITKWQKSYDGRKNEPIHLPIKFPLLLAQGAEGIAVGLSTKILPHNPAELIDASIKVLQNKNFEIFPDFATGGTADVRGYQEGKKGGRIRIRAHIEQQGQTLIIREVPFSTSTTQLIESILKANDSGKIKIKKIVDNTAENVEVVIDLAPSVSPEITINALYACTLCEVSIATNCCVIVDDKPCFLSTTDLLQQSTYHTRDLILQELEYKLYEKTSQWERVYLEQVFIEKKIYLHLEKCTNWDQLLFVVHQEMVNNCPLLKRPIEAEDLETLLSIPIRKISKYSLDKSQKQLDQLSKEVAEIQASIADITNYTINFFRKLKTKYFAKHKRITQLSSFETIETKQVVIANKKLYAQKKEGFVGLGLKKEEFISDCSDMDDIIVFLKNGLMKVIKVEEKAFVGRDITHVAVWNKEDLQTVYNVIYLDGESGVSYVKRFCVTAVTRGKEYHITKGSKGSKILFFEAMPEKETPRVLLNLSPKCKARNKEIEFDFTKIAIKSRSSQGNIVTKYPISKVKQVTK